MSERMTDERLAEIEPDCWMENTHEHELLQALKAELAKVDELEAAMTNYDQLINGLRDIKQYSAYEIGTHPPSTLEKRYVSYEDITALLNKEGNSDG